MKNKMGKSQNLKHDAHGRWNYIIVIIYDNR